MFSSLRSVFSELNGNSAFEWHFLRNHFLKNLYIFWHFLKEKKPRKRKGLFQSQWIYNHFFVVETLSMHFSYSTTGWSIALNIGPFLHHAFLTRFILLCKLWNKVLVNGDKIGVPEFWTLSDSFETLLRYNYEEILNIQWPPTEESNLF